MSDSADGTDTGLKPDTIQLDSMLTVSCSTGQSGDTILTFAGEPAAGRSCWMWRA